jgi:amino-acid N-acetyltransferase
MIRIRPAQTTDLDAVQGLLQEAGLPLDGVADQFGSSYAVAEIDGAIVGAMGMEVYDLDGLLRSAVVMPSWQGRKIGEALLNECLRWSVAQRLRQVYLLTTTAERFFSRHGFHRIDRDSVPASIRRSREFRDVCPVSAVVMMRPL